jgi:hypothetical protein
VRTAEAVRPVPAAFLDFAGASGSDSARERQANRRCGSVSAPVINSRSADTVVVVPDGQTVVYSAAWEGNPTD